MTLRTRILFTLAPLLLLTAALGAADAVLLYHMGRSIDYILRDNLRSVDYMVDLNTALSGVDDALRLALHGRPGAQQKYDEEWARLRKQQDLEDHNITILPREAELTRELAERLGDYRRAGDRFLKAPSEAGYFGAGKDEGLRGLFRKVRDTAEAIRMLNEKRDGKGQRQRPAGGRGLVPVAGRRAGRHRPSGLAAGLDHAAAPCWGRCASWPRTAEAVGAGNLNQLVPTADDEIRPGRPRLQPDDPPAPRLPPVALRPPAARPAHRPGRPRLLSRSDIGGGPRRPGRDGQPGRQPRPRRQRPALVEPGARRPGRAGGRAVAAARRRCAGRWTTPSRSSSRSSPQAFDQTVAFRLDGEDRAYLPQMLPIRDPYGNTLGAAVVLSDVTRFRLLDQIKSDLAATVSHELKTPLTGVRLALHLLLEETVGPLTPKQTELLVDARDNAERCSSTIEHLLALARLEHGGETLELRPEEAA